MARSVEQIVQEQLGMLFMQYAATIAAYEAACERIKELEMKAHQEAPEDK